MARVLLAWELGSGLGHVHRLVPVARGLEQAGHEVLFAVRDPAPAGAVLVRQGFRVLQAPAPQARVFPRNFRFRARSYADILWALAFDDQDSLEACVAMWDGLFGFCRPDLILSDYSPFLAVAAWATIPHITLGDGFVQPPADLPSFPALRPDAEAVADEGLMLEQVTAVLRRRGRPGVGSLPRLISGDRAFVCTLPEVDPYRGIRPGKVDGPLAPPTAPAPPAAGARFFAYLAADFDQTEAVLGALACTGLEGGVFVRHASPPLIQRMRDAGLTMFEQPPPLLEQAAACRFVVHHGGHGTTEQLLALGRPQLLVPRHLEQTLTAGSLAKLGAGVAVPRGAERRWYYDTTLKLATHQHPAMRTGQLAQSIAAAAWPGCLGAILAACEAMLG